MTENRPVDGDACACGQRPAGMSYFSFSHSIDTKRARVLTDGLQL